MGNQSKMGRIIGGLLIGGLLLGGTSLAMADGTTAWSGNANTGPSGWCGKMAPGPKNSDSGNMQSVLDSLVASNRLTQAQADQILARRQQLQTERQQQKQQMKDKTQAEREALREQKQPDRVNLLTQLVNEGVITQQQVEAIQAAMQEQRQTAQQERIGSVLNGLVEKQAITTEQAAAVQNKLSEMQSARQAEMDKLRDMTPEQRRAYMKENRPADPLSELVTAGVLTQEQADQIQQAMGPPAPGNGMHKGQGMHRGQGNADGQQGPQV